MSNLSKARKAASSPEARAKAKVTRAATMAAKADRALQEKAIQSLPLSMIPDKPERKPYTKKTTKDDTRQQVVLALLKYLNGE